MNNNDIAPTDAQRIFSMLAKLIAIYRKGKNVYVGVDLISEEWERQGLPCEVERHAKMHNLDCFFSGKPTL